MAGVFAVNGHMDDGSHAVAVDVVHTDTLHQFVITRGHGVSVHLGNDAVAADLLNVADPAAVDPLP